MIKTQHNSSENCDIRGKIKEAKWRWAGHVSRIHDDRWTYRLTEWQPRNGKQRRGRPKKRWRDEITAYMGTTTWTRIARNRSEWKCHEVEGFIQQWMDIA